VFSRIPLCVALVLLGLSGDFDGVNSARAQSPLLPGITRPPRPKMPGQEGRTADVSSRTFEPGAKPIKEPPKNSKPFQAVEARPFGANLFKGNFMRAREDGLNPEYVIMPGDRVAVQAWGAVNIGEVFVVDGQGNIFLPGIGPIHLQGVRNQNLTAAVRKGISGTYKRAFDVYTNLITAKPVAVFVTGGVMKPGRYAGVPSDSVLFFLDQAGGINPRLGSYRKISILRQGAPLAQIDLYDFILQGRLDVPQLKEGDTILVHQRGPVVEWKGDVAQPSLIEFETDKVIGAEALAIVPGAARATEVTVEGLRRGRPIKFTAPRAEFGAFELQDGDTITLRDDGRPDTILIKLEGEHEGSAVVAAKRGTRLVDLLNHIPVNPELANTKAVHIRRESVAKAQKDSINDSLFRLERSALLALSGSRGESDIRIKEAELTRKFVDRARLIQPLGRVVTSIGGQQQNMVLEDGDVVVIPPYSTIVRVSGEVLMSQAVMFNEGLRAEDYISLAGGYSTRADDDRVILMRADASVEIASPDVAVAAGDEILVPPRVDTKLVQNVSDITQIIYQVAVAAAILVLF